MEPCNALNYSRTYTVALVILDLQPVEIFKLLKNTTLLLFGSFLQAIPRLPKSGQKVIFSKTEKILLAASLIQTSGIILYRKRWIEPSKQWP